MESLFIQLSDDINLNLEKLTQTCLYKIYI